MSKQKKPLAPHAVTCIKKALLECLKKSPNYKLAFLAFCDREDCWDCDEVISGYQSAVNIQEIGDTVGEKYQGTREYKATLQIEIQVYSSGCEQEDECLSPSDVALSVLAYVQKYLCSCDPDEYLATRIKYNGFNRVQIDDYAEQIVGVTGRFQIDYRFDTCETNIVHQNKTPRKRRLGD